MIHDVIVAGAGPVGLFLACELRLAGLSVLVLEQQEDPSSPFKRLPFGMRGLSAPSIEAFYRRGMLEEISSTPTPTAGAAHWMGQPRQPGGHFAGIQFYQDKIDVSQWPWRLPGPAGTSLMVDMESLERVLDARARAIGAELRRGAGVVDVEQRDDSVVVHAGDDVFRGRWLVGCDGGRSTVRKVGGFEFVGTDPAFTGYSVEVELAEPEALPAGRHYTPTGMYTYGRPGIIGMVDFDGGAFHRTHPVTREHVQEVLRRVSCTDATVTTLRLATTWTDRARQATTYRRGRVLLAGDAAHTHSPLGGQGLNLGLGDALNLGWKLAATLRDDAPEGLLDSYTSERHPVGAQVLDWSRAQVALMRPSRSSRALEAIVRDLIDTRDGATYFAERVWGVSLRYDLGDDHPLVGRSAPDFELVDGARLGQHLGSGKGLLVDFDARASTREVADRWSDRVVYVTGEVRERLGVSALLVRPDGIVAWATGAGDDASSSRLAQALARWFGVPAVSGGDPRPCDP
jgi:2-polyprenyl-6-methoxyphenol hydroxylase-like FAD-dependent oxidoreductase